VTNLFEDHVPLLRPWLGDEEVKAVAEVIMSGWISQGPRVIDFENAVASFVGPATEWRPMPAPLLCTWLCI